MIGNVIFGIFPLIFMLAIFLMSEQKFGGTEVDDLVYEGSILFVCLAIVGSVLVDFYLSGVRMDGFARFATYFFPAIILFIIAVNYFLIHIHMIDKSRFALTSYTSIITISLSIVYVIFVKTNLYMKEDYKHEPVV